MKAIILQITPQKLKLTPVEFSARQQLFYSTQSYELPEPLQQGKALNNIQGLATFVKNCMADTGQERLPLFFCLEDSRMIVKEFRHLPVRPAELLKLARLEAESVLQGDADEYVVITEAYAGKPESSKKESSVLYAVPRELVRGIAREFRQRGLRVKSICPAMSGLLAASCSMLDLPARAESQQVTAVLDLTREHLRLVLFCAEKPVFQKDFSSVYEDIQEVLQETAALSPQEAEQEMRRPGFLLSAGEGRFGKTVSEQISLLLETAAAEIVRNFRVVLSSERLELNRVYLSGSETAHPDFIQYATSIFPDIPLIRVEDTPRPAKVTVRVEEALAVSGGKPGDYFSLSGLLFKRGGAADFLAEENLRQGTRQTEVALLILVTAACLVAVSVQLGVYQVAKSQQKRDAALLGSVQVRQIQQILEEKTTLQKQADAYHAEETELPKGESHTADVFQAVQKQVAVRVNGMQECTIDNVSGTVMLTFYTGSVEQLNTVRKAVEDAGFFRVLIPFSANYDTDANRYQCTVTLKVKDFQPLNDSVLQAQQEG